MNLAKGEWLYFDLDVVINFMKECDCSWDEAVDIYKKKLPFTLTFY